MNPVCDGRWCCIPVCTKRCGLSTPPYPRHVSATQVCGNNFKGRDGILVFNNAIKRSQTRLRFSDCYKCAFIVEIQRIMDTW
ncbi:unnamed protein product [Clavelina lepadiformis]|uniref:Uncharacterized protein n=1 Tax=Clavelina lepadiformis TaxID=159417 RepID=A0ABP0FCE9_CLALP